MTINGGQPHQVGYRGQPYVITVWDEDQQARRTLGWRTTVMKWAEMKAVESRPGWSACRCEPVADKQTGAPPP